MKEDKKKSKKIGYILGVIAFILVAAGATYAWLTWRSNNIVISGSSECFDIIYTKQDLGTAQNPVKIRFQESYVGADYASVSISLDPNCANVYGVGSLYLTTNVGTDAAILTGGLYYTLTSVINGEETFIKEGPITTTGDILLTNDVVVDTTTSGITYRVYVWINGPITTSQSYVGASYSGQIRAEVVSTESDTAANYIKSLYTNATKDNNPPTINGITYTLAPSVNLMRDQFGSDESDPNTGNIRYYGANPNNYVWLGDTYTEDVTFPGYLSDSGYADYDECVEGEGYELDGEGNFVDAEEEVWANYYCNNEDIVRHAGDKKLWRIIGVFNNKLKIIAADPISTQGLSWDSSAEGVNYGYGINQWGPSGSYEGADLMRFLNDEDGAYWTKDSDDVYTGWRNTTTNVSFENSGLSSDEQDLITNAVWYTGAYMSDNYSYVDEHYTAEREAGGKRCTQGTQWCNDTVTRTNTWTGKVGLMNASDFGYSTDLKQCNQTMDNYWKADCILNAWLRPHYGWEWTMSPFAGSVYAYNVFCVSDGGFANSDAHGGGLVRPVVYLKSGVTISGGNGSESQPFEIEG